MEHHMYGSTRLGTIKRSLDADQPKYTPESITNLGNAYLINFTRGNKLFEMRNAVQHSPWLKSNKNVHGK